MLWQKRCWLLILVLGIGVSVFGIRHFLDTAHDTIFTYSSGNGQWYSVLEYAEDDHFRVQGEDITCASLSAVMDVLENKVEGTLAADSVSEARDALDYGIAFLNQTYESWTANNRVGVFYNETADVWGVHGMVENRYQCGEQIGLVIVDADTGAVLGYSLIKAD